MSGDGKSSNASNTNINANGLPDLQITPPQLATNYPQYNPTPSFETGIASTVKTETLYPSPLITGRNFEALSQNTTPIGNRQVIMNRFVCISFLFRSLLP